MINVSAILQYNSASHQITTQNTTTTIYQHSHMSTAVPADTQCYVTHCHQYTPEHLS